MQYVSYIPENITPITKCIIMLHGVGSNEGDLFSLKEYFSKDTVIISLQGSFSLGSGRFAWYPVDFSTGNPVYMAHDVEQGYDMIVSCVDEVMRKYGMKSENIFLLGFSQGAIMSYYTLWRSPEMIGGIIALSGRLLAEIDSSVGDVGEYEEKKVFIGHGIEDTVIPSDATRATSAFIRGLGIEPTIKFYNAGHTITREEIMDIQMWLKSI